MEINSLTEILRKYGTSFPLSRFQNLDNDISEITTKHAEIIKMASDADEKIRSSERERLEWFGIRENEMRQSLENHTNEMVANIENAKSGLSKEFWLQISEVAMGFDWKIESLGTEMRNEIGLLDEKTNKLIRGESIVIRSELNEQVGKIQQSLKEHEQKIVTVVKGYKEAIAAIQSNQQAIEMTRKRFDTICRNLAWFMFMVFIAVLILIIK